MGDLRGVRRVLEQALAAGRRDWALGTTLSLLLLPLLLALAALLGLVALGEAGFDGVAHLARGSAAGAPLAIEVSLGLLFLGFVAGERGRVAWGFVGAAAAGVLAMAALAHGTSLPETAPGAFWTVHGAGAFGVLALMGAAYTPRDEYYLGLFGSPWIGDPFTIQDDVDRAHLHLGLAVAIPRAIVAGAADIVGGAWLLAGLSHAELEGASRVLLALGRGDPEGARRALRALDPASAAQALRALERLKLTVRGSTPPRLAPAGANLLAASGADLTATGPGGPRVATHAERDPRPHDPRDRPPRARAQP